MKKLFLLDAGGLTLNKKEKNLYFLLLIFFFALYMPGISWLYNVCMWLFFVYSLFFNSFSEKWMLLKKRKEIILILSFFLLNFLSAISSENTKEGIAFVGFRISLLIIPLAIGTVYINNILKERLIFGFAFATFYAAVISLAWGFWRALKNNDWSLSYNDNLSEVLNLQSIYFAMLVNLAIFSFLFLLMKNSVLINKNSILPVLAILLITHFLLASRVAIIILYSSVFIIAIVYFISKKNIYKPV